MGGGTDWYSPKERDKGTRQLSLSPQRQFVRREARRENGGEILGGADGILTERGCGRGLWVLLLPSVVRAGSGSPPGASSGSVSGSGPGAPSLRVKRDFAVDWCDQKGGGKVTNSG